jgi:nucleoside-diphosphate-sugar epimerase
MKPTLTVKMTTMAGRAARSERSGTGATIAVTGARGELGSRVLAALASASGDEPARLIGVDTTRGTTTGVVWRRADVRDPALAGRLGDVDVLVHLATDRRPDTPHVQRRPVNVRGTDNVLSAAAAARVGRVVLVTSAMVYGATADNPVPLPDDAPVRAEPDLGLLGDWVEMERLAAVAARRHRKLDVAVVRPATVVGDSEVSDAALLRLFDAPRLLALKGSEQRWQFCHVDDLVDAIVWAATGRVAGPVTVGCDGWLSQPEVERLSGRRSVTVAPTAAFAAAERLHRVGAVTTPASELRYLAYPWVIGSDRLRAAGWNARWDNATALRAHLDEAARRPPSRRLPGGDVTRAAAATVALAGTVAVIRASRRRRRG